MKSPKKTKRPRIPITMTNQFDHMPVGVVPLPNARPVNFDHPYYQVHPWSGPRRRSYYATPKKLKVVVEEQKKEEEEEEEEQKKTIGNPCELFYKAEGIDVRDFAVEAAEQKKREEERMRAEAEAGVGDGQGAVEGTMSSKKKKRVTWAEPETTA
ncbi:hypothetical protein C8A01DRAFT_41668 [Parachaetomium inaequale]|uniref:Uncharacterized protein n=1 Tax=Parachaetomium inaequale TaxID=2588326 RepID=A0AAN6P6U5_9PEZI|nr:hypothetical protein C8A01DRAFT_41668 [Parachaetomium inaequale]